MRAAMVIAAAFLLDMLFGDPAALPHIVTAVGRSIAAAENRLRAVFPKSAAGQLWAGAALAFAIPVFWGGAAFLAAALLGRVHAGAAAAFELLLCWQCLAARSLQRAAEKVKAALKERLGPGRRAVSEIVGRDTAALDEPGVIRAAVETVAENCCDGVVAPLFFMAIGGAPLAVWYKAVNTLDSMVGYKNEKYLYFGRASARLDDAANFIPARLSAAFLLAAALVCGYDARGAARIFRRDRLNHKSPNSAQGESVCAGALGIRLGGGASYFGRWVEKPYIGDDSRAVTPEDITRANRMMLAASAMAAASAVLIRGAAAWMAI